MSELKEKDTGISVSALKELLAENNRQNAENMRVIVEQMKKPTVLEQKELDAEAKKVLERNEERKANAAGQKMKLENKRVNQRVCNHKHRLTGQSHCVEIIVQNQPTYLLCQKNQCKIFPGTAPEGYTGTNIYDSRIFYEIAQTVNSNGSEILD